MSTPAPPPMGRPGGGPWPPAPQPYPGQQFPGQQFPNQPYPPPWPPQPGWVPVPGHPVGLRMPTEQTTLKSLSWLLVCASLLVASLVMPMIIPAGANWLTGPTLMQHGGPHLINENADGMVLYFVTMACLTAAVAVALLLGAARLLGRGLANLLGIVASVGLTLSLFLSLVLLVGAAVISQEMTAGVAAYGLPLGFFGTVLACFVPSIRDGWIRPPKP